MTARAGEIGCRSSKYVTTERNSRTGADQDGEAGLRDRAVDEADRGDDERRAVLDRDGRIFRRGSLHHHEHDEQRSDPQRLRSGYLRGSSMHALALASGTPSALLDWNNNYGDDPNKAVCFHCSNLPKHFFQEVGWISRRSSRAPWARKIHSAPASAE